MVVCSFSSGQAAEIEVSGHFLGLNHSLVLLCKSSIQEQGIVVGLFLWFYVCI